jgi:hypothetical protein
MKMRSRISVVLGTVLLATSLLTIPVSASVAGAASTDADAAKEAAQSFVNHVAATVPDLSSWKGAYLINPQLYYNLDGNINAYMFAIQNHDEIVGHVLVGSSAYGFPVFEAGEAAPPAIPPALQVKTALQDSLPLTADVKDIGSPVRLLYLGVGGQYALYNVNGELIGVNLVFSDALKFSEMKSLQPSPEEYRANRENANAARSRSLYKAADGGLLGETINFLVMGYYSDPENDQIYCGPCSGVSIGHYYKWYSETGTTYPDLWSDYWMYEILYDYMQAQPWVYYWNYGPGWTAMAEAADYDNFVDDLYTPGSSDYFNRIVPDIDSGWPHALCYFFSPSHWVAVKGYDYSGETHYIICTDSQTSESWRYIDWDNLPADYHRAVCISDDG